MVFFIVAGLVLLLFGVILVAPFIFTFFSFAGALQDVAKPLVWALTLLVVYWLGMKIGAFPSFKKKRRRN